MFSHRLTQWLSRYRSVTGTLVFDPYSGRSLGPASGNLGDVFPFMVPNALTGLFAGLSISGFNPSVARVLEYRSRTGFRPTSSGPCSGNRWQTMTGEDWSRVDPTGEPLEVPSPVHDVDLQLAFDQTVHWTGTWRYHRRDLSRLYRLHWWQHPDGLMVSAVTFITASEFTAPFLRPCYATATDAVVDPVCLFPLRHSIKLFGGLIVLSEGSEITLTASTESVTETPSANPINTNVLVSKTTPPKGQYVKTLGGIAANKVGNVSLTSTGTHRIVRQYEELDAGRVRLSPHTLWLLSQDAPCCSCNDYVAAYETLRELFQRQKQAVLRYNEAFEKLKTYRDALKERLLDAAKLIRVRREKTTLKEEAGRFVIRCELAVVYSNAFATEYAHRPVTIKLLGGGIIDVKPIQRLKDDKVTITRSGAATFEIAGVTTAAWSHQAIRLEAALTPDTVMDFSFAVVKE